MLNKLCAYLIVWLSFSLAGDLPGDRLERKCQQLENLAHAVISMAKTEDVIVDFCSGGVMDYQ